MKVRLDLAATAGAAAPPRRRRCRGRVARRRGRRVARTGLRLDDAAVANSVLGGGIIAGTTAAVAVKATLGADLAVVQRRHSDHGAAAEAMGAELDKDAVAQGLCGAGC